MNQFLQACILFFALVLGSRLEAADSTPDKAWYGIDLPRATSAAEPFATPDLPQLHLAWPADRAARERIGVDEISKYIHALTGISRERRDAGDKLWGRVAGFEGDAATARYLSTTYAAIGLTDVRTDVIPLSQPQWAPTAWSLRLKADPSYGPSTADFEFVSAFPALPEGLKAGEHAADTKEGGIDAELLYVGMGTAADLIDRDVRGKAVVIRSALKPGPFFATGRTLPEKLGEAGAAMVITIVDHPQQVQTAITGMAAHVPAFSISDPEGKFLEAVIARSAAGKRARVLAVSRSETRTGLSTHNVTGMIRGKTDDFVIVTAHHDGYFEGANDNASGVATLLALARQIAAAKEKPTKSYLFAATGAHHAGFTGSRDLVQRYRKTFDQSVLVLNCEHTAGKLTTDWQNLARLNWGATDGLHAANTEIPKFVAISKSTPVLRTMLIDLIDRYGITAESRLWNVPAGDALSYVQAGYRVLQLIEVGTWYHTSADIEQAISAPGLERVANAYGELLQRVDRLDRNELPFVARAP